MLPHRRGHFEITLTKGRAAAALAAFNQGNSETKCLQDLHRGDTNMWFMVTDEGIVPKNNVAAIGRARRKRAYETSDRIAVSRNAAVGVCR